MSGPAFQGPLVKLQACNLRLAALVIGHWHTGRRGGIMMQRPSLRPYGAQAALRLRVQCPAWEARRGCGLVQTRRPFPSAAQRGPNLNLKAAGLPKKPAQVSPLILLRLTGRLC